MSLDKAIIGGLAAWAMERWDLPSSIEASLLVVYCVITGLFGGFLGGHLLGVRQARRRVLSEEMTSRQKVTRGLVFGGVAGLSVLLVFGAPPALVFFMVFGLVGIGAGEAPFVVPSWSWSAAVSAIARAATQGLCAAGLFALVGHRVVGLLIGLASAAIVLVDAGLVNGLTLSLDRRLVARGFRRSLKYSLTVVAFGLLLTAASLIVMAHTPGDLGRSLSLLPPYVVLAMTFLAYNKGGAFCLRHLTIRAVLMWNKRAPWDYREFLEAAAEHRVMRSKGGSYEFYHDLFRQHLAARKAREHSA